MLAGAYTLWDTLRSTVFQPYHKELTPSFQWIITLKGLCLISPTKFGLSATRFPVVPTFLLCQCGQGFWLVSGIKTDMQASIR